MIDENGLYTDTEDTGLTFSFNTYDLIKQRLNLPLTAVLAELWYGTIPAMLRRIILNHFLMQLRMVLIVLILLQSKTQHSNIKLSTSANSGGAFLVNILF